MRMREDREREAKVSRNNGLGEEKRWSKRDKEVREEPGERRERRKERRKKERRGYGQREEEARKTSETVVRKEREEGERVREREREERERRILNVKV